MKVICPKCTFTEGEVGETCKWCETIYAPGPIDYNETVLFVPLSGKPQGVWIRSTANYYNCTRVTSEADGKYHFLEDGMWYCGKPAVVRNAGELLCACEEHMPPGVELDGGIYTPDV